MINGKRKKIQRKTSGITTLIVISIVIGDLLFALVVGLMIISYAVSAPSIYNELQGRFSVTTASINTLTASFPTCCGLIVLDYIATFIGALALKIGAFAGLMISILVSPFTILSAFSVPLPFIIFLGVIYFIQIIVIARWFITTIISGGD